MQFVSLQRGGGTRHTAAPAPRHHPSSSRPSPKTHPQPSPPQLRNRLEFLGGVTDTYLTPAKGGIDTWNVLTGGSPQYRVHPGSQPPPRLPTSASARRTYDIAYYPRDTRRNRDPTATLGIEESFTEEGRKLLAAAPVAGPNDRGSLGGKVRAGGGAGAACGMPPWKDSARACSRRTGRNLTPARPVLFPRPPASTCAEPGRGALRPCGPAHRDDDELDGV